MHRAAASSAVALSSSTNSFRPSTSSERFSAGSVDAYSQGMQDAADTISLIPGLRLEGVSLFGGYSSNAVPRGLVSSRGNANLGSDYDYGGQATLAFRSRGATSSFGLTYTPSHVQRANFSQWSSTNHVLSLRGSKSVGPRWTIALNANAADTGLEQFWLNAPVLRTVTNRPTTLEELFSAVEAGELSDDEFASVLTGAPVVDDPGGPGFDSSRILSASAGASVSYAYSPRISFVFGGSGSRTDLRGGELSSENRGRLYVRNTQSTNGFAQARYRLSPATTILVTNRSTLSDSTFLRTASNSTLVGIEQQLTRRISYGLGIGAGYFNRLQSRSTGFSEGAGSTWAANSDFVYTRGAHRLIAQANRSVGDPMGFGALNSWSAGARWIWAPARARWTVDAGFNYLQTEYGQARLLGGNLESNLYSGGLVRRLNASTALRSEYYYGRYVSPFTGVFSNTAIHRVQTSLIWRPVERR